MERAFDPAVQRFARRFGKNVRRCRERADLSQERLAIRASMHRTGVNKIERGYVIARIDTVVKLAGALEVPIGALFEGMRWTPGELRKGVPVVDALPREEARLRRELKLEQE